MEIVLISYISNRFFLFIEEYVTSHPSRFVEVAPKTVCKDGNHMEELLQDIMDKGGEGIILRDPDAGYLPGRSSGFLKHKVRTFLPNIFSNY